MRAVDGRRRGVAHVPAACQPRQPRPGRGPTMVPTAIAPATLPLIIPAVHAQICGFTSRTPHPLDRALAQCSGCRLWIYLPSEVQPGPLQRVQSLTCPRCTSTNVGDLGGYAECRECGHGFVMSGGAR